MLQRRTSTTRIKDLVARRAHATPNYVGHGVGGSLATHALAAGGYSLYLLCAAWLATADLPEWMPPQSGVRSLPQAASQAIVLQATYGERVQRDVQLRDPAASANERPIPPPLDAKPLELEQRQSVPLAAISTQPVDRAELVADPNDHPPSIPEHQRAAAVEISELDVPKPAEVTPRPARVAHRGRGPAIATLTSVASVAALESHGVETDALPQQLYNPEPDYPPLQYAARIGGTVRIRIRLLNDGRVRQASIYQSSGVNALDEAALTAVRRWRFEAASDDRPTVRELVFPIRFDPPR